LGQWFDKPVLRLLKGSPRTVGFIPVRLELVEGPRFGSILVFVYAVARHLKSGWRAAVASSRRETGVV